MVILILLSVILVATGIVYASKKGVPESVSDIAYIIPKWVFAVWIALSGMMLVPQMFDMLGMWRFVGFLMVVGLLAVAASPYYKTENKALHYVGGIAAAVFATAVTGILASRVLMLWVWVIPYIVLTSRRHLLFIGELTVYVLLVCALIW